MEKNLYTDDRPAQPEWGILAHAEMRRRRITVKALAEAIGYSRSHVSTTLNGTVWAPRVKRAILNHLNLIDPASTPSKPDEPKADVS